MRRIVAPLTAAMVAIAIGLVISSVASAARAADSEHLHARVAAERAAAATEAELAAYRQRLDEAYAQLALTYQVLESRDAQYAALAGDPSVSAAPAGVSAATVPADPGNAPSFAGVPVAYVPPAAAAPSAPSLAPVAAAAPAPAPAQAAKAMYCWYDHDGHYVCEDHPQGK